MAPSDKLTLCRHPAEHDRDFLEEVLGCLSTELVTPKFDRADRSGTSPFQNSVDNANSNDGSVMAEPHNCMSALVDGGGVKSVGRKFDKFRKTRSDQID